MLSFTKGKEFEDVVEYIYSSILSNEEIKIELFEKRYKIEGKSGVKREFDIYYEFKVAGHIHKVAIECKNYKNAISIDLVDAFIGKLRDFNNIHGVIISKNGYQKGAKQHANYAGIEVIEYEKLPRLNQILASKLAKVCLPTVNTIGRPFYVIMEKNDAHTTTGTYYLQNNTIILFISRKSVKRFIERYKLNNSWSVYGVSKEQLGFICSIHKLNAKIKLAIVPTLLLKGEDEALFYSPDEIKNEFLID